MIAPHRRPLPGPAADFGAGLSARLPRLETPRTVLRAPRLADAPASVAILVPDAEGHRGGPHDETAAFTGFAAAAGLWLLRGHGLWTVTDRGGRVLGFVLIGFEPGDRAPEPGWLFLPEARGRGLAAEAAAAARDPALRVLGLPERVSCIAPTNAASRDLARRLGAAFAGVLPDPDPEGAVELWRHHPEGSA